MSTCVEEGNCTFQDCDLVSENLKSIKCHPTCGPVDRTVEQFLTLDSDRIQAPAAFSWQYLRDFMGKLDLHSILTASDRNLSARRCLFDSSISKFMSKEDHTNRSSVIPPDSDSRAVPSPFAKILQERKIVNAEELLQCFQAQYGKHTYCKTIVFITDMSPEYAAAIAIKIDIIYAGLLREYFQCHLSDETEFIGLIDPPHNAVVGRKWPRHMASKIEFALGFHLPYVALRYNTAGHDPRGVRETISMIKPLALRSNQTSDKDLVCHEAQISFLIIGNSPTDWFAICNVDSWFENETGVDSYLKNNQDGPSAGARTSKDTHLHPREYFLLVLSLRFRQISSEWGNVCTHLTKRLDTYETHYLQTIDSVTGELHDDKGMSRTRSYSKAASMLRQYCDTISVTTGRLEAYLQENNEMLFGNCENFEYEANSYRVQIDWELAHLNRWRKRLRLRMQRFEVMREGLLSASTLQESRRATKQGHDIGMLTYVTILYLPFSTAATVFGMSGQLPETRSWISWVAVSILLGIVTYISAFRPKLKILFLKPERDTISADLHKLARLKRQSDNVV